MNKEELQAIAKAAAKNLKTEQDLNEFSQMLTKISVEAALNAELDDHLGYSRHEKANTDNSRNGFTRKTLQTKDGQFELNNPRDRDGFFELGATLEAGVRYRHRNVQRLRRQHESHRLLSKTRW